MYKKQKSKKIKTYIQAYYRTENLLNNITRVLYVRFGSKWWLGY